MKGGRCGEELAIPRDRRKECDHTRWVLDFSWGIFNNKGCCTKSMDEKIGEERFWVESGESGSSGSRQPENSKRAHLRVLALLSHTPKEREREKRAKMEREMEKQSAKFRAPTLRAPTPLGPHPFFFVWASTPRDSPFWSPPPLRPPHLAHNTSHPHNTRTEHTHTTHTKRTHVQKKIGLSRTWPQ